MNASQTTTQGEYFIEQKSDRKKIYVRADQKRAKDRNY